MTSDIEIQVRDYTAFFVSTVQPVVLDDITQRPLGIGEGAVRPIRPLPPSSYRRGLLGAAVAAAAVLVLLGGVGVLFNLTGSDSPASSLPVKPPSPNSLFRVPHDGAVFGGEGSQEISGVTFGGPGLVAVGSDGGVGPWDNNSDTDAAVWTSLDGITWSRVPHDETAFGGERNQVMSSVIVGGPGLVAVGWDGQGILDDVPDVDAAIWTSVDGYTWSRVPHDEETFGGAWIESVIVGGSGLIAVGGTDGYNTDGDAAVWTSPDGITWTRVPHDETVFGGVDSQFMSDVTVGGPGLVAVGSDGGIGPWDHNNGTHAAVWTSPYGITWTRVPNDEALLGTGYNPAPMLGVTSGGPGLVAVGSARYRTPVWTSPDGTTWTRVPDDETVRGVMFDVAAGGPGLVAVGCMCGASWTPVVWTSVDGITWTPIPDDEAIPGDRMYGASVQGPNLVAVGTDRSGIVLHGDRDAVVWIATLED